MGFFNRIKACCKSMHRCVCETGRNNSGMAIIEFTILVMPMIALLLATFETAIEFFAAQCVETATEQAARMLLTGQAQQASSTSTFTDSCDSTKTYNTTLTAAQFKTVVYSCLPSTMFNTNNLVVTVSNSSSFSSASTAAPTITFNSDGSIATSSSYSPGTNGTITTVTVSYLWPVQNGPLGFTLDNTGKSKHIITSTSVFQVEPY